MLITLVVAVLYLLVLLPIFRLHFRYGWLKSLLLTVVVWYVVTILIGALISRMTG